MEAIYAPNSYENTKGPKMFLAGSIDMGSAEEWQEKVIKDLKKKEGTILNPRRKDWDSSLEQSIENEKFREQVEWELNALDDSDIIFYYFSKDSKAPITFMELGLHIKNDDYKKIKNILVYCPEGFYRKGNIDIVCKKYGIMNVKDYDVAVSILKIFIDEYE